MAPEVERVQLLNPESGKRGMRIERRKYDVVRRAILDCVSETPGITFATLLESVATRLPDTFGGSPSWYTTAVKLDLEARGEIRRVAGARPQRLEPANAPRRARPRA